MDSRPWFASILLILIIIALAVVFSVAAPKQNGGTNTVATNLTQTYSSNDLGISIRLPNGYNVTESSGQATFTIPSSVATGTNLGTDTHISVEETPYTASCKATAFLQSGTLAPSEHTVAEGNTEYSVASTTGAGAGNRYEETVYALPGTNPCVAVHYFIHYGVIENYPPGAVKEFDKQALLAEFDAIRRTLVVR